MAQRKYIRVALNDNDEAAMVRAKADAEKKTGIAMSDSMFILSVIRHALSNWSR